MVCAAMIFDVITHLFIQREKPANGVRYTAPKPSSLTRIAGVVSP
jgi:hypothetical protein